MSAFDSPIARCEAVRELVLTDETQAECAREHGCPPSRICPLAGCFHRVSGIDEQTLAQWAAIRAPRRRGR